MAAKAFSDFQTEIPDSAWERIEHTKSPFFDLLADIDADLDGAIMVTEKLLSEVSEKIDYNTRAWGAVQRDVERMHVNDEKTALQLKQFAATDKRLKAENAKLRAKRSAMRPSKFAETALRYFSKDRPLIYAPFKTSDAGDPAVKAQKLLDQIPAITAAIDDLEKFSTSTTDEAVARALADVERLAKKGAEFSMTPCFRDGHLRLPMKSGQNSMGDLIDVVDNTALLFLLNRDQLVEKIREQAAEFEKRGKVKPLSPSERAARKSEMRAEIARLLYEASAYVWKARALGSSMPPPVHHVENRDGDLQIDRAICVPAWLQVRSAPVEADPEFG